MSNNQASNIQELSFSDVIGDRFGRYSKYIIQDRALPDIRDGLKPVQRRILYAMYKDKNTAQNPYRKSARTVGNVIGQYHPHGDLSVYEAMVRMSQDWKNREPLIDMHGNNGSMDGDPAAAMRYTEARLSPIASEMLKDLDYDTVDHQLNFDDTTEEPIVLPAHFPNLLVNGATGISAGYATDIPPHNLREVVDALVYMLSDKDYNPDKLTDYIKGPDFPTGGIIQGADDIQKAYKTGKASIVVRSVTDIETIRGGRQQIVVSQIPYDVNKARLIQKIDEIRLDQDIDGIAEVRDESDITGVRIVIELKRNTDAEGVLNYLLLNTDLQTNYHFNMVAINNLRPELVNLETILKAYIDHQYDVIRRRSKYKLKKDQDRLHIVEGLIRLVSIIDEVIALIRRSQNRNDAKENLIKEYDFSSAQAEAIVTMQLYRLTNTDVTSLQNEQLELNENIALYKKLLSDQSALDQTLIRELKEISQKYGSDRLTQIQAEVDEIEVDTSIVIPQEQVMVSVTKDGYIKQTSMRSFAASNTQDLGMRDLDYAIFVDEMSTHDVLLIFTDKGNYIYQPVNELEEIRWNDPGIHLSQNIKLDSDESIIAAYKASYNIDDSENELEGYSIYMMSEEGIAKQTPLSDFVTHRSYKTKTATAIGFKTKTDRLAACRLVQPGKDYTVFTITRNTYGLYFDLDEIPSYGPKAKGVIGINLSDDDRVVDSVLLDKDWTRPQIIALTQRGNIKRFDYDIAQSASRASKGLQIFKELKTDPHRIIGVVSIGDDFPQISITGDTGYTSIVNSSDIPLTQRLSNGSELEELSKLGKVNNIYENLLTKIDSDHKV